MHLVNLVESYLNVVTKLNLAFLGLSCTIWNLSNLSALTFLLFYVSVWLSNEGFSEWSVKWLMNYKILWWNIWLNFSVPLHLLICFPNLQVFCCLTCIVLHSYLVFQLLLRPAWFCILVESASACSPDFYWPYFDQQLPHHKYIYRCTKLCS